MSNTAIIKESLVERVKDFREENEFWVALGRTSEWEDERSPPEATGEETEVEEVFAYIKSEIFLDDEVVVNSAFVKRDEEDGWLRWRDRTYRVISEEDIYDEFATSLMVEVTLADGDFPDVEEFRQAGLYLDLTPEEGYEDEMVLAPENVEELGQFYGISNFRRVTRVEDRLDTVRMIVHFQEGVY